MLRHYRNAYAQGFLTLWHGVACLAVATFGLLFLTVTFPLVAPHMLCGKEEKPCTD